VVTGGSSGIGFATAKALARAGARLVLVARAEARLRAAADELARMGGPPPLALTGDVADPDGVLAMARTVERDAGTPDILVNNAGIGHWAPVAELPLERIRAVLAVNFFGAVHWTKAVLPAMLARGQGTLVFVSSGFGALPFPYTAAYCASKHAMNGFAGSLRAEVEPRGLRVLLVLPGGTRTAFFAANTYPEHVLSRYLWQRSVPPDRVGTAIVRAAIRGRRRLVVGPLNDLGLRLTGALPEVQAAFLALVGRRLERRRPRSAPGEDVP
jgi:short-subunit dehydrogenase